MAATASSVVGGRHEHATKFARAFLSAKNIHITRAFGTGTTYFVFTHTSARRKAHKSKYDLSCS